VKILDKSRPATSLLDVSTTDIVEQLIKAVDRPEIKAAYLFGSLARNEIHAWSDIDLILVVDSKLPFIERPQQFTHLFENIPYAIDLLVYTQEEFAQLSTSDSGFWKTFQQNNIRLK